MKKKILFVLPYYKIGGTLTSFVNLIPLIDKSKYELFVFALTNEVDDMSLLPKGINYIGLNVSKQSNKRIRQKRKSVLVNILKSLKRWLVGIGYDPSDSVFKKMAKPLSRKYDCVIAFQEGQSTRMAQYIEAPMRIAWIHSIYSRLKSTNPDTVIKAYNNYDKIVCVSHTAAKDMIYCEPQWEKKIYVVYNAVNTNYVVEKASIGVNFPKKINIVSIGRIDPVKRFSSIPEIASKLKEQGISFDWWIIGGVAVQEEYQRLLKAINHYDVLDCVHPIGALSNPYPYIKSCNMLVCLSLSETFNYTIAEAQAIGTPIVSTDFACVYEFVEHEKSGLVLPFEQIADGILRMLNDKQLSKKIKDYLRKKTSMIVTKEQFECLCSSIRS